MNRYIWDGSYTVEAAFIVPMVLGIYVCVDVSTVLSA